MMFLTLLAYVLLGALLGWPLYHSWRRLSRALGWRRRALTCIRPYTPPAAPSAANRPD